ncbi:ABC transporter ATP-binding protein [Salinirubellus salinus]|uniref:ABC-type D-xylose/L-arabinose transporter n=1 Tax=Salinirubellus salinus TaxID=1364945 RepID=A0A9E7R1Z8_9EURY|nr:ABC transporter ATP-binding protein [Salinirubellus salinus]UWM53170.1 ABC transporter ATP-binding protein [Salinirubellus salinus]
MTVQLDDVTRVFGDGGEQVVAVDGIDLTIEDGEFVTLVGPSGCGKTTTLRCVSGLDTPTGGTITFGDRDVTDLPPQQRDIALLFQDIALYPHMSVRDNMAYGLKIAGEPKSRRYEKVQDAAELLQITDQLDKSPASLSGGQQQRVALGRSLVRDPTVFLFDEPMSDLDAKLKRELRPVVEQVTEQIGCPVLYVTHDQEEAMTLSDRVAVMNDGNLEQVGKPKAVYDDPATEFVASFIGQPTTQLFDAEVAAGETDDEYVVTVGEHAYTIERPSGELDEHVGDPIRLGVRPQYIEVVDADSGIPATHLLDEPLGDATHSFFETEFGEVTVVTHADFEGEKADYGLDVDPEQVMLFDPGTGRQVGSSTAVRRKKYGG